MNNFERVYLNLEEMIVKKGISKTQLSYRAEVTHTQVNRFCKNDASRIDFATLAKLCTILECVISDLVKYEPPK